MEIEKCPPHELEDLQRKRWEKLYREVDFFDDVHGGKWLDKEKVIEARKVELEFFRKMGCTVKYR